jgi:hypothetical protein
VFCPAFREIPVWNFGADIIFITKAFHDLQEVGGGRGDWIGVGSG